MAAYKDPSFQERTALAQKAREKALKQLAARPPLDEAEVARRKAAREAAEAKKAAAREAAIANAKEAKAAKAAKVAAASVPVEAGLTEEELKAARDARYAARKKRKG